MKNRYCEQCKGELEATGSLERVGDDIILAEYMCYDCEIPIQIKGTITWED